MPAPATKLHSPEDCTELMARLAAEWAAMSDEARESAAHAVGSYLSDAISDARFFREEEDERNREPAMTDADKRREWGTYP